MHRLKSAEGVHYTSEEMTYKYALLFYLLHFPYKSDQLTRPDEIC
eukprot:COSAG05_NODE_2217_length_3376_cov_61.717410_1_plen_44_part_10